MTDASCCTLSTGGSFSCRSKNDTSVPLYTAIECSSKNIYMEVEFIHVTDKSKSELEKNSEVSVILLWFSVRNQAFLEDLGNRLASMTHQSPKN